MSTPNTDPQSVRTAPAVVLVVGAGADASAAVHERLGVLLRGVGLAVRAVAGSDEALREVGQGGVDLVLLELERAGEQAGLGLLRTLRASERLRHVPVLCLGSGAEREPRLAALRLGADDVLALPCDEDVLLARVARCLETKRRIDGLSAQAAELQTLSTTDGLTQVSNHRHFQERLREEFRRAQRYADPLSLILVDLDHFKAVNDAHGHLVGDRVLSEVAATLRHSVRDTDLLARCGGEEFAVLLPRTALGGSLTVAERIWRDVAALQVPLGAAPPLRITASVGVGALPQRSITSAEALFHAADEALYRAKREGRNRVCLAPHVSLLAAPPARVG